MNKIVFSISIEDINRIAENRLKRKLTANEMQIFIDKFDLYDWVETVECLLDAHIPVSNKQRN